MFLERWPQVVGRHKELGITKGFQWANTQDDLLACSFSGIDLPIELIGIKFSRLRFYTIPVGPQANELKWIDEQCLQDGSRIQSKRGNLRRAKADAKQRRMARF